MNNSDVFDVEKSASQDLADAPSFERIKVNKKPTYCFFKRTLDIILSLVALIVAFPFMLILSLIIIIDSPGASPIYRQKRIGMNGKVFWFYKFRTMVANADDMLDSLLDKNEMEGPAFKIKDDPRITRVGKFIRRTSIDELPQLWNVLKGDMSVVGPRPEREYFYVEFEKEIPNFRDRLLVAQGLTCIAQVNGCYDLTPAGRLDYDIEYIQKQSAWTDFKCILKTFVVLFNHKGAR